MIRSFNLTLIEEYINQRLISSSDLPYPQRCFLKLTFSKRIKPLSLIRFLLKGPCSELKAKTKTNK